MEDDVMITKSNKRGYSVLAFALAFIVSLLAPSSSVQACAVSPADTKLIPVFEKGQEYYDLSDYKQEIKVKLTDASGNPLVGKTVDWKEDEDSNCGLTLKYSQSITDSDGIAKNTILVELDSVPKEQLVSINTDIAVKFEGDTKYAGSIGSIKVYREFVMSYKMGDANMDGSADALDLAALGTFLLNKKDIVIDTLAVDMNNDGKLDAIDFVLLKASLLR